MKGPNDEGHGTQDTGLDKRQGKGAEENKGWNKRGTRMTRIVRI